MRGRIGLSGWGALAAAALFTDRAALPLAAPMKIFTGAHYRPGGIAYGGGRAYRPGKTYSPNGKREVARRLRQIERGSLKAANGLAA